MSASEPLEPPVDLDALGAFLTAHGLTGPAVTARRIGDGHANITYLVTDIDAPERRVVVRRPPPPPLPPGANDVLREARVVAAVGGHASGTVPVPIVLATAEAGEGGVFDVPFFVMSYVDGPVATTALPGHIDTERGVRALADDLVDRLAALHALDWTELGIRGRPDGANRRQRDRLALLVADEDGAPPPAFAEIDAWLIEHAPAESGAALVHHDYRLGNVILDPRAPRVAALLDWELATIGDPLVDLGYLIAAWAGPDGAVTPVQDLGSATAVPGAPTAQDLAARYASTTGARLDDLAWYVTLAHWKLAVLYEYSRRRHERGDGDPYYAGTDKVASFLEAAHNARHPKWSFG